MKILMTVLQFPPFGGAAVSRIYSFAKYWSRAGHEVTVLTPRKYAFMGQTDYVPTGYEAENFRVIEVAYSSPLLTRTGAPQGSNVRSAETSTWWLQKVRSGLRKLRKNIIGSSIDVHRVWQSALTQRAMELLEQEKFDALFSSFSPQASHVVASAAKAHDPSLLWVADYRDLWTGNHLLQMHPLIAYFQRKKERKLLANADILTTVSEPLAEYLKTLHQKDVEVIFNGYDHEELAALPQTLFFPDDGVFRIVYTGTIYEGIMDIRPFFKALQQLDENKKERIKVYFYGDSVNVTETAQEYGVASLIHIGGILSKQDALRAQRDADMLLFLLNETLSAQGVLTSKIFEYFASGTPVLAIGIDEKSPIGRLLQQANSGEAAGREVDRIKAILLHYMHRDEQEEIREKKSEVIRQYRREEQAKRLERKMMVMLTQRQMRIEGTKGATG